MCSPPDKAARAESPHAPPGVASSGDQCDRPESTVLQDMNQEAPPDGAEDGGFGREQGA